MVYVLLGYCKLSVECKYVPQFLEMCMKNSYPYKDIKSDESGNITLIMRSGVYKLACAECRRNGIEIALLNRYGLPHFLKAYRARVGLIVGGIVAILIILSFQNIVWDVRVSGNEKLTDTEVLQALESCGFGVGSSKRGFKADVLENRVMINDGRIAWISVNIKGTVAYVQIRESKQQTADKNNTPANLVAARSGVIQRIELKDGNVIVSAGQRVNEGELLVSGIYDSTVSGFRITRAEAKVYARCVREINIFIPRVIETREYSQDEDVYREFSLIFFGKEIKFFKKGRNASASCDIIQSNKSLTLIRGINLPISLKSVWFMPYQIHSVTRTDAELERLAYFELSQRLSDIPGGAELIKKTVVASSDDNGYYLECTVVCIEDIAKTVEFEVTQ